MRQTTQLAVQPRTTRHLVIAFALAHVVVTPTSGLVTTEAGGQASFSVVLDAQPLADVVIGLSSSDLTEGRVAPTSLTFTYADWSTAQQVVVTGLPDKVQDGNVVYYAVTAAATSSDPNYNGLSISDVEVTNTDMGQPFNLALATGWNLISLPVEPLDPAVESVLDTTVVRDATTGALLDGGRGVVYSGSVWHWVPAPDGGGVYEAVTAMHAMLGYWVAATQPVVVTVVGVPPQRSEVALLAGWNMIGPAARTLNPEGNAKIVGQTWLWDPVLEHYAALSSLGWLEPGFACWLFATQPFVLGVPGVAP